MKNHFKIIIKITKTEVVELNIVKNIIINKAITKAITNFLQISLNLILLMFLLKITINYFDNIYLFKCDMITIIKIDFLNDVKTKTFKYFDMLLIRIIFINII